MNARNLTPGSSACCVIWNELPPQSLHWLFCLLTAVPRNLYTGSFVYSDQNELPPPIFTLFRLRVAELGCHHSLHWLFCLP
jgi:hypothetical protein